MLENIAYQQLLEIRDKMRELGIYEIHNEIEFRKAIEDMAHSWGSEAVLGYHSPKEMALDFDYGNITATVWLSEGEVILSHEVDFWWNEEEEPRKITVKGDL